MIRDSPFFLGYTVKWFVLDAMYKIDEYTSAPLKRFLHFWRVICFLLISSCVICSSIFIKNSLGEEFEKYAMNYMITFIYVGGLARLLYHYAFDWKAHNLIVRINSVFKYAGGSSIEEFTVEKYVKQVYYMTKAWIIYTTFNVMFMNLSSVVFSTTSERTLPFNFWYPYDWKVSPFYEISVFHQTISQLVMSSTYGNSDLFFICASLMLAGQFSLIGFEFGNVFYDVLLRHGINKEDALLFKESCGSCGRQTENFPETGRDIAEIYDVVYSKKFNDDLIARFGELIRFHQDLLSVCNDLNDFFDPLQLSNFLFYVVYLTFMAFILATSKDRSLLISCGEYLIAACVQVYLITYFAQELTTQAEQLFYDLYEFPWHMCGKTFQTVFRFVHLRALMPVHLNIGNFGTVSLSTFLLTIKTSFSYFTVLRQVAQEQ